MPLRPRPPSKAPGSATRTLPARSLAGSPALLNSSAPARVGPGTWPSPSLPIAADPLGRPQSWIPNALPGCPRSLSPHPLLSTRPGLESAPLRPSSKTPNAQTLEPERGPQTKSVAERGCPCPAALLPAWVPGRTRSAVRRDDGRSKAGLRAARGRARPPGWPPAPAAGPPRGGSSNRHGRPAHRSPAGHLVSSS